ncbi:MAG: hypothetical protein RMJ17_01065 [Candidatus Aenigmarchaeota archaeon]|nr:hypothetical protein [Candidatus Aenigmarchaeota archaeon]MDW8149176.1 hypothetical protein [Candidatus Aenigmarchaeota archaeon]
MRKIAISSMKTGVGRTFFSFSLSYALREMGKNAIAVLENLKIPTKNYLENFLLEKKVVDNYITYFEGLSILVYKGEVELSREAINLLLTKLEEEKKFDILIFDISCKTIMKHCELFDEIIFISLPYKEELIELKNFLKNIVRKTYVVINFLPTGMEIDEQSISNFLGVEVLGKVNYDESVQESIYYRLPVVFYKKYSLSSKQIFEIAHKLLLSKYKEKFFYKILRFFDSLKKSKIKLSVEELSV